MTEIKELVEKLKALQKWATPGPWEIHDSCSWRRIGTARHDGNVLCPTNSRTDNHPDLTAGRGEDLQANLGLIVGAVNALPQLLDAIELLSSQVEELKAGWQPMLYDEELYGAVAGAVAAPKDGRHILVWAPWLDRPAPAFWCDRTAAWDLDCMMVEDRPSSDPDEFAGLTHWRPLPAPPALSLEAGKE